MESNADGVSMGNIGKYEIRLSWREKVKIEVDTARVAPVSSKSPPPKPPSTYSSDKPVGGGADQEKENRMMSRLKRERRKGMDSKGKDDPEGKESKGDSRGWKALAKKKKEDRDATSCRYSSKTVSEENWGPADRRRAHSYRQR